MMPPHRGPHLRRKPKFKPHSTRERQLKRKRDVEDIESLNQQVLDFHPTSTSSPELFSQLPLSQSTQSGLKAAHYTTLTPVQAQAIPVALRSGQDVLCAAMTGSGKSLAFLIPCLENLYRKRWSPDDGLGALILSPTRELAVQLFDVLRSIGQFHYFSAGLVIGGKSFQEEKERIGKTNILVATPGRILAHLDSNADFDVGSLQVLVLDESDMIMSMGFENTLNAILDHLPKERQNLLFSATLSKKVSDLVRLHLSEPEFISVHEESRVPSQMQQNYVSVPLENKVDTLWSFVRANTTKKLLIFFSSAKQVRFVYESFRHLQPGLTLLHLHGRQNMAARLDTTTKFKSLKSACLLSTDVASRGLDIPSVDIVVQFDAPENVDSYIHRVGRCARYRAKGSAVLFLDPSEVSGMLDALHRKNVNGVEEIHVRQKHMQSIRTQCQNMCFKDPALKYLGQKAFTSYVRSIHVRKDKDIFDVKKYNWQEFAKSLGLLSAPRVKFIDGGDVKKVKNMPRALAALENDSSDDGEDENTSEPKTQDQKGKLVRTKYDKMFQRENQDVLSQHYKQMIDDKEGVSDSNSDDDIMVVKARYDSHSKELGAIDRAPPSQESTDGSDAESAGESSDDQRLNDKSAATNEGSLQFTNPKEIHLSTNPSEAPLIVDSNRRAKLLKGRKALLKYKGSGRHVVFDEDEDDNHGKEKVYYEGEETFRANGDAAAQREQFLDGEREKTKVADDVDREVARVKRREKKIKRKEREREMLAEGDEEYDGDDAGVELLPYDGDMDGGLNGGSGRSVGDDQDEAEVTSKPSEKKKRKWFEDAESGDEEDVKQPKRKLNKNKRRPRVENVDEHEPRTLEDLEAMAAGLLAQ